MEFPEEPDGEGECTGYIVSGMAGGGNTFLHKNRDARDWREGVVLVVPDDGHKYLAVQHDSGVASAGYGLSALSGINDHGVAGATYAGFTTEPRPESPWSPSAACRHALQHSATAREYVTKFAEIVERHGIPAGISGSVSPNEGWRIEYAAHRWESDGPYIDDYSPIANVYTITAMKQLESGGWRRQGRLRKSREILERNLYPNSPGKPWFRQWDIEKAFAFSRNQEPLESPFSGTPAVFGPGAPSGSVFGGSDPRPICDELPYGRPGRCVSAHIAIPDTRHPDYLSVLWWSLDRPTNAPFIPLFIGITEVPVAIATNHDPDAPFAASDLFNTLRLLIHEHTEYRQLVSETWRKFETRQHRLVIDEVDRPVREHLAAGRESEARAVLDGFLHSQVDEAMDLAQKLVTKIEVESAGRLQPSGGPADLPSRSTID